MHCRLLEHFGGWNRVPAGRVQLSATESGICYHGNGVAAGQASADATVIGVSAGWSVRQRWSSPSRELNRQISLRVTATTTTLSALLRSLGGARAAFELTSELIADKAVKQHRGLGAATMGTVPVAALAGVAIERGYPQQGGFCSTPALARLASPAGAFSAQ